MKLVYESCIRFTSVRLLHFICSFWVFSFAQNERLLFTREIFKLDLETEVGLFRFLFVSWLRLIHASALFGHSL